MALEAICTCGCVIALGTEQVDGTIHCPDCGGTIDLSAIAAQSDPIFDRDRFLLPKQAWLAAPIYDVRDEHDRSILYGAWKSNLVSVIVGMLAGLAVSMIVFVVGVAILRTMPFAQPGPNLNLRLLGAGAVAVFVASALAAIATLLAIASLSNASFRRDSPLGETVFEIVPGGKLSIFRQRYTLVCPRQGPIATISKNSFHVPIRKSWWCHDLDGNPICTAYEGSIRLALLRRLIGPASVLIRADYVFVRGSSVDGEHLGEYERGRFERRVLDLSADPTRSLDRRIALAMAVLVDVGDPCL